MSVKPEVKLPILLIALAVIIPGAHTAYLYSNSIPLIQMDLTKDEKAKLNSIGSVKLSKAGYFNIECKSYNSHEHSYATLWSLLAPKELKTTQNGLVGTI